MLRLSKPLMALSVATFGFGFIIVARELIRSRNRHFISQHVLSLTTLNSIQRTWSILGLIIAPKDLVHPKSIRSELLWIIPILSLMALIYPVGFLLMGWLQYLLIRDLAQHEMWEKRFFDFLALIGAYNAEFPVRIKLSHHRSYYNRILVLLVTFTALLVLYFALEYLVLFNAWPPILPKILLALCLTSYATLMYLEALWWLEIVHAYSSHLAVSEKLALALSRTLSAFRSLKAQ